MENKIDITLKAKHLRFIAYLLKSVVAQDVFSLLMEIKIKVTDEVDNEDEISINVTADDFIKVYPLLSEEKEGMVAEINKEMDYILRPQIMNGLGGDNAAEWGKIGVFVQNSKEKYAATLAGHIEEGKQFLK